MSITNPLSGTNEDFNEDRCFYCGSYIFRNREKTVPRENITRTAPSGASDPAAPYDITINAGCWFCGCPQPYR